MFCAFLGLCWTDLTLLPVYEGVKSFYKEDDETVPVNVYGKSKVAAEQFISANCSNFAILRSSIIFGAQTISPVPKSLPIQVNMHNGSPFIVLNATITQLSANKSYSYLIRKHDHIM